MKEEIMNALIELLSLANTRKTTKLEIRSKIANLLIWLENN